jgi:hypothetical protein
VSPFRTFEHDRRSDRSVAMLRAVGAVLAVVCVLWLGVVLRNWVGLLMGLLGILSALVWAAMIAKARRRAREGVSLRLTPEGLVYDDGGRRTEIGWPDVCSVEVDEERLVVRVERADGEAEQLEPMFHGVGVYDLADAVRSAWHAALPARSGR